MKSFNPYKYSDLSKSGIESVDLSEHVVEKGHKNIVKVDLQKFEEKCRKLKDKKDLKIKKLTGQDKDTFNELVKYVHLLYGTEYYTSLYDIVQRHYKNIGTVKYGTIGAYFSGCLNSQNSCSLACAGAMPVPKSYQDASCDKAVIMGELNSEGNYDFSFVRPAETSDELENAYLFVENTLNGFQGLEQSEKLYLKNLGCKQLKVVTYSDDMTYNSSDSYVSIDDIKERSSKSKVSKSGISVSKSSKYSDSSYSSDSEDSRDGWSLFWLIFLLILLIVIILALLYFYKYKLKK